jgi:hypothetical protein
MPPARGAHASAGKYTGSIRRSTGGEEGPVRRVRGWSPESARRGLAAVLVGLRAPADATTGEWWQRALPQERVVAAEQAGRRTLAATARRQGLLLTRHNEARPEDVRP